MFYWTVCPGKTARCSPDSCWVSVCSTSPDDGGKREIGLEANRRRGASLTAPWAEERSVGRSTRARCGSPVSGAGVKERGAGCGTDGAGGSVPGGPGGARAGCGLRQGPARRALWWPGDSLIAAWTAGCRPRVLERRGGLGGAPVTSVAATVIPTALWAAGTRWAALTAVMDLAALWALGTQWAVTTASGLALDLAPEFQSEMPGLVADAPSPALSGGVPCVWCVFVGEDSARSVAAKPTRLRGWPTEQEIVEVTERGGRRGRREL